MALLDPYNPVPQVHQVSYALKEDEYGALVLAGAIDLQRLIWFKWPESVYCALYGLLEWKGPEGRDIRKDDKRRKFTSQSTRFLTLRQEATASRFDDRLERHYAFQIPLPDEIVVLNCDPVPLPPSFKAVKEVIRPKGRCNFHLGKTKLKAGITVRYWLEISIHPGAQNISWVRSPKDTFMDVTLPKREAHIPECATEAQYDGLHYVVLPNPVSMDRVHPFTVRLMCVIPTVSDIEIFLMRKVSESERNAQKQLFKTEQIPTRVERYSTEQGSHIIRGTFSCAPTVPTFSISFLAVEYALVFSIKFENSQMIRIHLPDIVLIQQHCSLQRPPTYQEALLTPPIVM